jgi:DDE superfamily endonuclease
MISCWLRFTINILINILQDMEDVEVKMPDDETVRYYQHLINQRHMFLDDVYCFVDRLKLRLEKPGSETVQNAFYNGWMHSHYVGNLFAFGPDGKILFAVVNAPGTLHDSTLADMGGFYEMVDEIYARTGGKIVADSAFSAIGHPCIIKSSKDEVRVRDAWDLVLHMEAT